ncbi:hypothetical protein D3C80_1745340 [compost metagenome]
MRSKLHFVFQEAVQKCGTASSEKRCPRILEFDRLQVRTLPLAIDLGIESLDMGIVLTSGQDVVTIHGRW